MADMIPTQTPGEFAIPALGKKILLSEWTEQDVYDVWAVPAATPVTTITELSFFTNVQGKAAIDTNQRRNAQTSARHSVIVLKPGVYVLPSWGGQYADMADQIALYQMGTYELLKNNRAQIPETHMWGLATGYGFVAYGVDKAAPGVACAPGSLGVASPGAIPHLLVPFTITPDDDFEVKMRFTASRAAATVGGVTATWTDATLGAADVAIMCTLHGFVKAPGTR
jgi:hypothetical protein